jgi:hypothetical protein
MAMDGRPKIETVLRLTRILRQAPPLRGSALFIAHAALERMGRARSFILDAERFGWLLGGVLVVGGWRQAATDDTFLQVEGAANALLQALESSAGEERGALAGYRAPGARGADLAGPPFGLEFADAVLAWANGWRTLPPGA